MRRISFVLAVALCLAGVAAAQGPHIVVPSGVLVTDSQGNEVGLAFGVSLHFLLFTVDGTPIIAVYNANSLKPDVVPYFPSTDCSGTAYAEQAGYIWDGYSGFVAGPDWTVFVPDGPAPSSPVATQSHFADWGGCISTGAVADSRFRPYIKLMDLKPLLQPPFKIEPFVIDPSHCVRRHLSRGQ